MTQETLPSIKTTFATPANFLKLEKLEKQIAALKEEADALVECGVDCQMFRAIAEEFTRNLENYRKQFFTPPPEL